MITYPEAMPATIARVFCVTIEQARDMHDDISGSTYEREIAFGANGRESYIAHYDTADGMLTITPTYN